MPTLTILRGLPASGKSTYAKTITTGPDRTAVRINRDDLRELLFSSSGRLSHHQERHIDDVERRLARQALTQGLDVIVDAMNLSPQYVKAWMLLAEEAGAAIAFNDTFLAVPIEELIVRDRGRMKCGQRGVGEKVIRELAQRFKIDPVRGRYPPRPAVRQAPGS
jgi:predicted kinase